MKFLTSLLLLAGIGFSLSGCNTLSTRRDLFSPTKGSGPYTRQYQIMHDQEGFFGISRNRVPGDEYSREEGIFGISHNPHPAELAGPDEGIFGISRNR